jgi:Pyridoxamine 5'-phosphate oxidase
MAKLFARIDDHLRAWIARQSMFFVATAPLSEDGHVNLSPKGPIGALRVLDDDTVAYLDVSGSGAETIAHVRENGRIVVMLCAFDGPPRILRLHGRGEVVFPDDPRFAEIERECAFENLSIPEARRAIVVVHVARVADSCGYGVPLMSFEGMREHHALSSAKKLRVMGLDGYTEHRRTKNVASLDGLPAVDVAEPVPDG